MASRAFLQRLAARTTAHAGLSSQAYLTRSFATHRVARAPAASAPRRASPRMSATEIDAELLASTAPPSATPPAATAQAVAAKPNGAAPAGTTPYAEAEGAGASAAPAEASGDAPTDWSRSYYGLSQQPFAKEVADVLLAPVDAQDVEIKPGMHPYRPPFILLCSFLTAFACFNRRANLPAGDQVPARAEPRVRAGRMGACAPLGDERRAENSVTRVRARLPRSPRCDCAWRAGVL